MKRLSELFNRIALKRLSKVETDPSVSHQHEMNGVKGLVELFGRPHGKQTYPATCIYISDNEEADFPANIDVSEGTDHVTWYDARENHPTRTEYRLYYSTSLFQELAREGDLLVIGFDGERVWMIAVEEGSSIENQILWLFTGNSAFHVAEGSFILESVPEQHGLLAGIESMILEKLGIEMEPAPEIDTERMIRHFGGKFPMTREFSEYARMDTGIPSSLDDPDTVLLEWWNREEALFRALEKHIVQDRLKDGFDDVDQFISFSLSVLNRRKSRAGHAFENHLERVFIDHNLSYTRGGKTEKKSKPDFIFPSEDQYQRAAKAAFPVDCLTILGAKTTCKDRWRQVTREADLVEEKHLVTLEPAISTDQTDEMKSRSLQLVVPKEIINTYQEKQKEWIMPFGEFLKYVRKKQESEKCR